MEFKDKLKKLRTEKGLSQQALADAIFVSRSAVAKWENGLGVPRGETFDALLEFDTVTVDGVEYPVQVNSFFVTKEPLKHFYIGELSVTVGNTLMWREPIK